MSSFMSQWVYTDVVKDHFMNPRNLWDEKENFEPDGVGEVESVETLAERVRVKFKNDDDYSKKKYDNLVTVDLVCHAVPSPKIFREYINFCSQSITTSHSD